MASVVDVHPRESIAGVHSTIRRQERLFLSSVHEVSAVSAIFSAFASDNIGPGDVLLSTTPLQIPNSFSVAHSPHCPAAVPSSSVIALLVLVLTLLQLALSTNNLWFQQS